ncbi:MAG: hypothetical protein DMF69_25030 [Acidobacteria bacterium]|nr:MAG: hypothetical protein DMF69_25030 [Acidobacteriota bacterium]
MPYLDFAFDIGSSNPSTKDFVDSFKTKFHTDPQNFSVITYDGAKLVFRTIENSKSIDAAKLVDALNGTRDYAGVFGPVSVTDRNVNFTFHFKQWH